MVRRDAICIAAVILIVVVLNLIFSASSHLHATGRRERSVHDAAAASLALEHRIAELDARLRSATDVLADGPPEPPRLHSRPATPALQQTRDRPPAAHQDAPPLPAPVTHFPPGSTVWVTFVNGDDTYRELMVNWARHLAALKLQHVVVAFDDIAAAFCQENDVPYIRHVETLVSGDFRADFSKFRKMGSNKPLIVADLLARAGAATVVMSDVDTVWMRDPSAFLAAHPSADILISTDCLSHWIETAFEPGQPRKYYHRCGHLPGATFGRAFNTGIIVFRNRPITMELLREWRRKLTEDASYTGTSRPGHGPLAITDQLAFNMIVERDIVPIVSAGGPGAPDWRVIRAMNGTLRLMPLPSLLFANGHVFFQQRLPQNAGVQAFVVHCTFQPHHTPGKRARLREEGLWLADPPAYYKAHRLMSYPSDVKEYIRGLERAAGLELAALHRHLHAMAYQLAQLRDAFAIARALNRTLVLPRFVCYCDQDWYASVLTACRVDGSDLEQPFICPLDSLLNPGALDRSQLDYRALSYLSSPALPDAVRANRQLVIMHAPADPRSSAWDYGDALHVTTGASAPELLHLLEGFHEEGLLEFRRLRPGAFGGFTDAAETEAFNREFAAAGVDASKWCCSGEQPIDVAWITWRFQLPEPLQAAPAQAAVPWRVPQLRRPEHCDRIARGEAGELNVGFLKMENHPCTFLSRRIQLPETLQGVEFDS